MRFLWQLLELLLWVLSEEVHYWCTEELLLAGLGVHGFNLIPREAEAGASLRVQAHVVYMVSSRESRATY